MIRNKLAEKWSFGGCRSSSQCYFGILNGSGSIATYSGNWQINNENGHLYIENINIKYWIDLTYCSFTILKLTTKELKIQDRNSRALLYFRSSKE